MLTNVPVPFQESYAAFEEYPKRRIYLPFSDSITTDHHKRLSDAEANDYCLLQRPEIVPLPRLSAMQLSDPSRTDVIFWEQSSTSLSMPFHELEVLS